MNHLEIEFKTMLTENEYQLLLPLFDSASPVRQINYYIDSYQHHLRDARIALRVRTFGEKAELTLKIPQQVGNFEYNQQLTAQERQDVLEHQQLPAGTILELLLEKQIPADQLRVLGSLETLRLEKEEAIGLLALDQSRYLGRTDYELELEVSDFEKGRSQFQDFLTQQGIQYKAGKSKIARFAESLKENSCDKSDQH